MVFSTALFLYLFLPIVLAGYYLFDKRFRNLWLLLASLFFYAWGESWIVGVMLLSCMANYGLALWLEATRSRYGKRVVVGLSVAFNLGLLFAFKYANFAVNNLNLLLPSLDIEPIELQPIALPIGISFFTFQALSYVIDVYRREAAVQRNPIDFSLYIALFPQLIAGPIVRYHDVAQQIIERVHSSSKFFEGVQRFIFGLTKKMLIANTCAAVADQVYGLPTSELTPGLAWLGTLCYTLQIYFDFSGYSDMAIGLGPMFGFRLPNFHSPYKATSITTSGAAGTSPSRASSATTSTSRSAATALGKPRRYTNLFLVTVLLWLLARRRLDVHGLGRLPRRLPGRRETGTRPGARIHAKTAPAPLHAHRRDVWLGPLPQ
jgi:alginate O-acetyltransferase complex protein AlgI